LSSVPYLSYINQATQKVARTPVMVKTKLYCLRRVIERIMVPVLKKRLARNAGEIFTSSRALDRKGLLVSRESLHHRPDSDKNSSIDVLAMERKAEMMARYWIQVTVMAGLLMMM